MARTNTSKLAEVYMSWIRSLLPPYYINSKVSQYPIQLHCNVSQHKKYALRGRLPPYATDEVFLMARVTSGRSPFFSFFSTASPIIEGVPLPDASGGFRKLLGWKTIGAHN